MAQITCKDVSLGYDGVPIVEHLNFTVNRRDYLCVVGENGSGKSTLMKTLLHLTQPLAGEIEFGDGLQRGEIGYLPQQTLVQKDFPASVEEIVLSGCQAGMGLRPFYGKEQRNLARINMERMDILALRKKCFRELSGGQQQRVLLARALCATRRILLLDEPVAGLDPKVTAQMYELIGQLNREGITIIMISHDVKAAMRYATHILHVGQTVFFGTKEDFEDSRIGRLFLLEGGEQAHAPASGAKKIRVAGTCRDCNYKD